MVGVVNAAPVTAVPVVEYPTMHFQLVKLPMLKSRFGGICASLPDGRLAHKTKPAATGTERRRRLLEIAESCFIGSSLGLSVLALKLCSQRVLFKVRYPW